MKKIFLQLLFVNLSIACFAQSGSEILLFDLQVKKNKVVLSNPKNITNHRGYDNQPSFHSDLPIVYYSSFNDDGRSEIKSFDYKTNLTFQVTKTNEREYSPTLTPDKQNLSCIIQRDNGAQDLGKYPVDGGEASVIIDNLIVGYHAWADNSHLAMFVLGNPNTLHYLRLPTKEDTIIAENIGRSLHKVPGERAISFIHKVSASDGLIKKLNTETMEVTTVIATLPGREDIAWTSDGKIVSSDGTAIYFYDSKNKKSWEKATVENGAELLKGVTRIAIDAKNNKIALVVAE